jgi:hypothetical protein
VEQSDMLREVLTVKQENLTGLDKNSMSSHFVEWEAERAARQLDLPQLQQALLSKIIGEIERAEESLREKNRDLAELIADHSSPLGSILEARRGLGELNAYLKGLQFYAVLMEPSIV